MSLRKKINYRNSIILKDTENFKKNQSLTELENMKHLYLPQIASPQQEVFIKTALGPQRGAGLGGGGKHSSVIVWLLHLHSLQLDCQTSPG